MPELSQPCSDAVEEAKELDKIYNRLCADANDIYGIERRLEAFLHRTMGVEIDDKKGVAEEDPTGNCFLVKAHIKLDEMSQKLGQIIDHINRLEDIY